MKIKKCRRIMIHQMGVSVEGWDFFEQTNLTCIDLNQILNFKGKAFQYCQNSN
jgi:hypothetical protein